MIVDEDGNLCDFVGRLPQSSLLETLRYDSTINYSILNDSEHYYGEVDNLHLNKISKLEIKASGENFSAYLDGKPHSFNGLPAKRYYFDSHNFLFFCKNGRMHNLHGPAIKTKHHTFYALEGKICSLSDYITKNPLSIQYSLKNCTVYECNIDSISHTTLSYKGSKLTFVKNFTSNSNKNTRLATNIIFNNILDSNFPDFLEVKHYTFENKNLENIFNLINNSDYIVLRTENSSVIYSGYLNDKKWVLEKILSNKDVLYLTVQGLDKELKINLDMENHYKIGDKMTSVGFEDDEALNSLLTDYFEEPLSKLEKDHGKLVQARVFPNGLKQFYIEDKLHNDSGPAEIFPDGTRCFWIYGNKISEEEFKKYNKTFRKIEFRQENGSLHRVDGPALIIFEENGSKQEFFYHHGRNIPAAMILTGESISNKNFHGSSKANSIISETKKEKTLSSTNTISNMIVNDDLSVGIANTTTSNSISILGDNTSNNKITISNGGSLNISSQASEKTVFTISDGSKPIFEVKSNGDIYHTGDIKKMYEKELEQEEEYILERAVADLSGSRMSQVWEGSKFGFKKGIVNASSKILAEKLVELSPLSEKEWAVKLAQLAILLGSAELVNIMPDGMRNTLKLDEENQKDLVSFLRVVSGENIGREAVSLALGIIPHIKNLLLDFSSQDLEEFANSYEASKNEDMSFSKDKTLDKHTRQVSLEDLISSVESVKVEEHSEVDYVVSKG